MSEKLQQPGKHEREPLQESKESNEQLERIRNDLEKSAEKENQSEHTKEAARKSVEKEAISGKELSPHKGEKKQQREYIAKEDKARTFKATMKRTQKQMSPSSRAFSKFIHQPTVEKVSEVASKTVARPSAVLGGGIAAFVGLSYVFFTAKNVGFEMSGSETFYLILAGWAAGIVVEFVYRGLKKAIK